MRPLVQSLAPPQKKLKLELPTTGPEILLLYIYPKELKADTDICIPTFKAVLFTVGKNNHG
jgi:hypothetical protein